MYPLLARIAGATDVLNEQDFVPVGFITMAGC